MNSSKLVFTKKGIIICLGFLLFFSLPGSSQNLNQAMADRIRSYLDFIITNPAQINLMENRLLIELKEPAHFTLLINLLQKKLEEDPDQIIYSELLAWTYLQEKDFSKALIIEISLDKRESGEGLQVLSLGRVCSQNQSYPIAYEAFNYIIQKKPRSKLYRNAVWEQLETKKKQILEEGFKERDYAGLSILYKAYIQEFKEGDEIPLVQLDLAKLDIEYLNQLIEAENLLKSLISGSRDLTFVADCKMELANLDILKGQIWEAALLLNQVYNDFKEEPMGQEALLEASKIYYYSGDFRLAKSQLDILKTATSQLTANDAIDLSLLIQKNLEEDSSGKVLKVFAHAELLIFQHRFLPAEKLLDSISQNAASHSLGDDILMAKYKMHFSQREYLKSDQDLQYIIEKFPDGIWADDALFHRARLMEIELKMPKKAMELYEQLIKNYPGSYYISESRKRFRTLRGDILN